MRSSGVHGHPFVLAEVGSDFYLDLRGSIKISSDDEGDGQTISVFPAYLLSFHLHAPTFHSLSRLAWCDGPRALMNRARAWSWPSLWPYVPLHKILNLLVGPIRHLAHVFVLVAVNQLAVRVQTG